MDFRPGCRCMLSCGVDELANLWFKRNNNRYKTKGDHKINCDLLSLLYAAVSRLNYT